MVQTVAPDMTADAYDDLDPLHGAARDHVWVHTANWRTLAQRDGLKVFVKGEGVWLIASDGKRYLDGLSGLWVVNVGHGRREMGEAYAAQSATLAYASSFGYTTPPAIALAEKIAEKTPGDLSRVFFCSGGSEAVESAMKIAKQYQALKGGQKRYKMIARRGSYHGATFGAMSLSGSRGTTARYFEPFMVGVHHAPQPDSDPDAIEMEALIEFEGPETVAAIIAEPISTAAGLIMPPPQYLKRLREIADTHGIVLIFDEVINGWGRTGTYFACEQYGVVPDILTMAKGLSSGYAPIAAAVVRPHIAEAFAADEKHTLAHGITFGGHPAAAAAALANIAIFEQEEVVGNAASMGTYLTDGLRSLAADHPMVQEHRGVGMMHVLGLTKDKATDAQWTGTDDAPKRLRAHLEANGMVTRVTPAVMHIAPPLILSREEADTLIAIVDASLTATEREVGLA